MIILSRPMTSFRLHLALCLKSASVMFTCRIAHVRKIFLKLVYRTLIKHNAILFSTQFYMKLFSIFWVMTLWHVKVYVVRCPFTPYKGTQDLVFLAKVECALHLCLRWMTQSIAYIMWKLILWASFSTTIVKNTLCAL